MDAPGMDAAIRCRRRRLTRFRVTALPTALETTKPARDGGPGLSRACTTSVSRPIRTPRRTQTRKSSEDVNRDVAGSTGRLGSCQPARRSRPFWRRAARIARPARVRMRRRKPWVRLRRRLLGWKVRLLTPISTLRILLVRLCPRGHRRRHDGDLQTIRGHSDARQTGPDRVPESRRHAARTEIVSMGLPRPSADSSVLAYDGSSPQPWSDHTATSPHPVENGVDERCKGGHGRRA
jgi:hypothetical protein